MGEWGQCGVWFVGTQGEQRGEAESIDGESSPEVPPTLPQLPLHQVPSPLTVKPLYT